MSRKLKELKSEAGRSGNCKGSIYPRRDGRWYGQVTVGYKPDGSSIRKTVYSKSRQEVARKVSELTSGVFANGYISVSPSDKTMFMPLFMDWYNTFKVPTLDSQTRGKTNGYIKAYIKPAFEDTPLNSVDTGSLQRLFNSMDANGIGAESIRQTKQLIGQFFKYAVKRRMLRENPVDDVRLRPKKRNNLEREKLALIPEQRKEIIAKLEGHAVLRPIVFFMLLTGVRPGELRALRWKDVDFEKSTISVVLAAQDEIDYDEYGNRIRSRTVLGDTKTSLSVRSFDATKNVLGVLYEWRDYQKDREAKTGLTLTAPDCFVFCTEKGTLRTRSGLRSLLTRFLKKAGMNEQGINFYTFRHTFATMLLEKGENPKVVQELMGHARVETTLGIYSHVISKAVFQKTSATIDEAFNEISE